MMKSSSFDQKLYQKLKLIVTVQRNLAEVSNAQIDQIGHLILNQKEIIETKEGVSILAQCFNDLADFQPKNIEKLAELFIYLQQNAMPSNYLHFLKDYVVLCIHTREKLRSSILFFLRVLLIRKAITLDSIIQEIRLMSPIFSKDSKDNRLTKIQSNNDENNKKVEDNENKNDANDKNKSIIDENCGNDKNNHTDKCTFDPPPNDNLNFDDDIFTNENVNLAHNTHVDYYSYLKKFRAITWFYPEINKSNPFFIQDAKSEIFYSPPKEFKEYDSETINKMMNSGQSLDPLAEIIRKDDIDSFLKVVSDSGGNFDVNRAIQSSRFERCSLLSHNPSLIQYSAYYNSLKIFKYLYLNKADIEAVNFEIYSLLHFAICGGSNEIIRILEQNDIDMYSGIPISIKYLQNDILSWLLENHFPKDKESFSMMGYNKFTYHRKCYDKINVNEEDDDDDDDCYDPKMDKFCCCDYGDQTNDDEDEEKAKINNGYFEFFDFDIVFQTILETHNYLALFVLLDTGMEINMRNRESGKTILHYSIQKGNYFIFKLLFSNQYINPLLKDKDGESPIIYSLKYTREKIFFQMIKNQKILSSLNNQDYIKLIYYANLCDLKQSYNYLENNWQINLMSLIDAFEIKTFCDAMSFLPLSFFVDQIASVLDELFKFHKYEFFCILASRALDEKSLIFKGSFYFFEPQNKKNVGKEFVDLCQWLMMYSSSYPKTKNYYTKYKNKYRYHSIPLKDNNLTVTVNDNIIKIYHVTDAKMMKPAEISIQFKSNDDQKRRRKQITSF